MAAVLVAALTGIFGTVVRSPVTPVCRVGVPCSAPAAHVTLEFSRGGRVVASATTNAKGVYRVQLAPGVYTVGLLMPSRIPRIAPPVVTVPTSVPVRRNFRIDTSIR